jgi:hypothetical protein
MLAVKERRAVSRGSRREQETKRGSEITIELAPVFILVLLDAVGSFTLLLGGGNGTLLRVDQAVALFRIRPLSSAHSDWRDQHESSATPISFMYHVPKPSSFFVAT